MSDLQTLYTKVKKENLELRRELALQGILQGQKLYSHRKLETEHKSLKDYCEKFYGFGVFLDFNGPSEKAVISGFVKALVAYKREFLNKEKEK